MQLCSGLTAKYTPCQKKVKEGNTFCNLHLSQASQPKFFAKAYPKPVRTIVSARERKEQIDVDTRSVGTASISDIEDDLESDLEGSLDTEAELQAFELSTRLFTLRDENTNLQKRVHNQREAINQMQVKLDRTQAVLKFTTDQNAELRRRNLVNQIRHEENIKELNNIISELTTEIRRYKKELTVSEINAESYKELLKCEAFFDVLKKIRNKVCPYLTDRRFHIESFMKNKKCVDTACKMLNIDSEELVHTFFEYKSIRNKLAHPLFEGDINENVVNII